MNDVFTTRVRAAAVAGWWTSLVAAGFVTLIWLEYLCLMATRPAWVLCLLGPDINWSHFQHICLCAIVAFKFIVWLLLLLAFWLTLWARQLKKRTAAGCSG